MEMLHAIIDETPNISVITKIEVLRFNASADSYKILEDFVSECAIFGLDDHVIENTISICKSNRIKLPDAIIAATAIIYDLVLLTRNVSGFKNIKSLQVVNPWEVADA